MAETQDGQEPVSRHHMTEGTCSWWQGGAGGEAGGMGGVDRTNNRGDIVEKEVQKAMEGDGPSNNGGERNKVLERNRVYDRG